jgi:SprT protein
MISEQQKFTAQQSLTLGMSKAETFFQRSFDPPELTFNQRGNIAGTAHLQKNIIKLNPVLLADNLEQFCHTVIPHELAHILVFQMHGRVKPHGQEWRAMMQNVFTLPPHVKHQMDVTKTQGKTFKYQCGCAKIDLSVRRHNKVVRRQQEYVCRKCNTLLSYVGTNSGNDSVV